jgi:hypothetical protein
VNLHVSWCVYCVCVINSCCVAQETTHARHS